MTEETTDNTANETPRPYWIPVGLEFDSLPAEIRTAIRGVINPAYRELVLEAPDGLQKSAGVTIVSLLWLEILDHVQMGRELNNPRLMASTSDDREQLIARHLRLVGAKIKASAFSLRLSEFREKYGRLPGEGATWAEPTEPPGGRPENMEGP
jgi:hypothetical protein